MEEGWENNQHSACENQRWEPRCVQVQTAALQLFLGSWDQTHFCSTSCFFLYFRLLPSPFFPPPPSLPPPHFVFFSWSEPSVFHRPVTEIKAGRGLAMRLRPSVSLTQARLQRLQRLQQGRGLG